MNEHRYFLGPLLFALGLVSCKPDPVEPPAPAPVPPANTGTLRVTLVPEWEGEPLAFFSEYRNFMDYRVTVELIKMYFGDVRLIGDPGDTTSIKDVDLFDFGGDVLSRNWSVPVGSYNKLRAALGVPADLNFANPANYGANHPLSTSNGTYWIWATGYRYVMFEGRYDPDPESTSTLITAYSIHPGMEPSYVEFELSPGMPLTIVKDQVTELVVRVAVDRFFHSPDYEIDLATENTAHGNNVPLQLKLVNNVIQSFTVE
jgi:hypothetical protein